jgi:lipooligosaccharide transport system permease protein
VKALDLVPGGPARIIERNLLAYRRFLPTVLGGVLEPFLFLLSIGVGVGGLIGTIPGPGGEAVPYREFVAPGLVATAAMNGGLLDTTIFFFVKLKYWKVYGAILATPLTPADIARGEIAFAVLKGAFYSLCFLVVLIALGLANSPLVVLALPAAVLIGWAFAAAGAAASGYMRSYYDFDLVNLVMVPSFLFSGTFFPLERYPGWLAGVVRCTPLYQGVDLIRSLSFGQLDVTMIGHVAYLVVVGLVCTRIAGRRLASLLTP